MLGSGIYGLIGKAAGQAGTAVWLSFLVALVAALLTALSYASLGSRYPRAGGAAYATQRAFRLPILSFTIGLALVCSGLTSVATQSKIFSANLAALFGLEALPPSAIALGFVLILTAIVFRGIRESMWVNVLCTLIEASGLLIVIAAGMSYWGSVSYFDVPAEKADVALAIIVVQASVLSFFAFIGFEDAINVAEECKDPQRTIPIGLMAATAAAAVLYIAVAVTAVSVVPPAELAAAPSPLTEVMKRSAPGFPGWVMTAIALFSVANTALVNYITGSRLIYGMSNQGLLHDKLGEVHEQRRTPHYAILALLIVLVPLVLAGSIADLAAATVLLLLLVFVVVNASLYVLIRREGEAPGKFEVPAFLPLGGAVVCGALLVTRLISSDWVAPVLAAGLIAGILVIYAVYKPDASALERP
ncbi:MAG: amino acid permease [Hyphomicrobium sp.]|nr:amino acid permease [Hyphomicrobium sp.]